METIWKYKLKVTDEQIIKMPLLAEILTVQGQGDDICLWALVNPEAEKEDRTILVFGTGNPIPKTFEYHINAFYIGTAQMYNGALVWHIFEKIKS